MHYYKLYTEKIVRIKNKSIIKIESSDNMNKNELLKTLKIAQETIMTLWRSL